MLIWISGAFFGLWLTINSVDIKAELIYHIPLFCSIIALYVNLTNNGGNE